MDSQQTHPDDLKLRAYQRGELDAAEEQEIEAHLGFCTECCEKVKNMPDTILSLLKDEVPTGPGAAVEGGIVLGTDSEFDESDAYDFATDDSGGGDVAVMAIGATTAANEPKLDSAIEDVTIPPANEQATMPPGHHDTQPAASGSFDLNLPPELANSPKYRVLELLGRGGMGDVYKAEHRMMQRLVALKLINSQLMKNKSAVERFHREVRAAARLSHPNIVTAYDAEQAGDVHFLVMEYVDGVELADVIRDRGPLPVIEACEYIRQAAAGLQHAHEQGMVHRDIKPQNLMVVNKDDVSSNDSAIRLSASALVKILDFGLANFAAEEAAEEAIETESASDNQTPQLTMVGSMMGTPDYMAPEQAEDAHSADIRADIYSLGCTLYCMLTGKAPFAEGSVLDKVIAHSEKDARPLAEFRDDMPEGLQDLVSRMMAKSLDERFQTPAEVIAAVDAIINPPKPEPKAKPPLTIEQPSRSPLIPLGVMAALLFAFCGGLAGVIMLVTDQGRLEIRSDVDDVEIIVRRAGEEVEIIDLQTGSQIRRLAAGDYTIALKGDRNDVKINNSSFTLSRWGEAIVTITSEATMPLLDGKKPTMYDNFDGESIYSRGALTRGESGGVHFLDAANGNDGRSFAWYDQRHEFNGGVLEVTGRVCEDSHANIGWIVNLAGRVSQPHGIRFMMMGDGRVWIGPQMFDRDTSAGPRPRLITHAAIKPAGQWNRLRLEMKGDVVEASMNGQQLCDPIKLDASINPGKVALGIQTPGVGNAGRVEFDSLALWDIPASELTSSSDSASEANAIREFDGEWQPLFNGKDLTGWTTQKNPELWRVENGILVRDGMGGYQETFLMTERDDFADFHLRATVRLSENANGGLFVRTSFAPAPSGYEARMTTDTRQAVRTGGLFNLVKGKPSPLEGHPPSVKQTILPNQWFTLEVIADGNRIVIKMDGKKTLDFVDARKLHAKGRLALQVQGSENMKMEIRSIEVGILPENLPEQDDEWQPLFNGKDLDGWAAEQHPEFWRVDDGVLVGEGAGGFPGTFLMTERDDFADFHLRANARLSDNANSGLFFRAKFDPAPSGYETQMTTDSRQAVQTGGLFILQQGKPIVRDGQPPSISPFIRPGQWFTLEVIAQGNRIVTKVDGKTTLDYADARKMYAKGRLAIQLHGVGNMKVEFKSIEVHAYGNAEEIRRSVEHSRVGQNDTLELDGQEAVSLKPSANHVYDPSLEDSALGDSFPTGWGSFNSAPPGAYRFEVIEGGRTGKQACLLEGEGQNITLPTNRVATEAAKRYAARGWVKLTGTACSAQVRLLYFDATRRYIGETRLGRVTPDDDWQLATVTDRIADHPEAKYVALAMALQGNGKAVFDDLELLAFDADNLPENFEEQYGRTQPKPARVLNQWVGVWETTSEFLPTVAGGDGKKFTGRAVSRLVLDDHFVITQWQPLAGDQQSLSVLTYDEKQAAYRYWLFLPTGEVYERLGQWDSAAQTLTLQLQSATPGVVGTSTERFVGQDRIETTLQVKSADGAVVRDVRATALRQEGEPSPEITFSDARFSGLKALEPLERMVGQWTARNTFTRSQWQPEGGESATTEKAGWVLDGRFVWGQTFDVDNRLTGFSMMTYVPKEQSYRHWSFGAGGMTMQWRVTWDEAAKTFHWQAIGLPDGQTGTAINRWIDEDRWEITGTLKDRHGQLLIEQKQEKRRQNDRE